MLVDGCGARFTATRTRNLSEIALKFRIVLIDVSIFRFGFSLVAGSPPALPPYVAEPDSVEATAWRVCWVVDKLATFGVTAWVSGVAAIIDRLQLSNLLNSLARAGGDRRPAVNALDPLRGQAADL